MAVNGEVDAAAVAQKLSASAAEHGAYRYAKTSNQLTDAKSHLQKAADLRNEAEALDPLFTAPIWAEAEKTHPHEELKTFYSQQLSR